MICLGIEGTAHTLGIGIVNSDNRVLADERRTYSPRAGIHPREAAQFIADNFKNALDSALEKSNLEFNHINLISFSQGPGLGPCLRTVATGARALSLHYKIPIIGVNHCIAHIEIGKITGKFHNPLVLYVSGGNTQILKLSETLSRSSDNEVVGLSEAPPRSSDTFGVGLRDKRYRIFGETLDIGIGNMLDKFGRSAGLKHPAGPRIEELAKNGKNYIELPYVVKGTDLSFSGVLTSAEQKLKAGAGLEDLCFSLQETAFSTLTEVTERALAHLKAKELLLTGGVGNNERLQKMLGIMAKEHNAKFGFPKNYCSDNGVMIAILGLLMYNSGIRHCIEDTIIKQKFRSDDVEILW